MTALLFVLLALSVTLNGYMIAGFFWLRSQNAAHAKCVAHIASVTSNRVIALAFRDAATRYDSIEEKGEMQRLAREKFEPDGPSMPALWMRAQAEKLDGWP